MVGGGRGGGGTEGGQPIAKKKVQQKRKEVCGRRTLHFLGFFWRDGDAVGATKRFRMVAYVIMICTWRRGERVGCGVLDRRST